MAASVVTWKWEAGHLGSIEAPHGLTDLERHQRGKRPDQRDVSARAKVRTGRPAVALPSVFPEPSNPHLTITISVHNDAGVPAGTRRQAEEEAQEVFEQAGIAVRWLHCSPGPTEPQEARACGLSRAFAIANRATTHRFDARDDEDFGRQGVLCFTSRWKSCMRKAR